VFLLALLKSGVKFQNRNQNNAIVNGKFYITTLVAQSFKSAESKYDIWKTFGVEVEFVRVKNKRLSSSLVYMSIFLWFTLHLHLAKQSNLKTLIGWRRPSKKHFVFGHAKNVQLYIIRVKVFIIFVD